MRGTLTLVLVWALGSIGFGQIWDIQSDWSDLSNPNGVWTFRDGEEVLPRRWHDWGGAVGQDAFGPLPRNGFLPAFMKLGDTLDPELDDAEVGDIVTHTQDPVNGATNGPSTLVWTCPRTGRYGVTGNIWQARRSLNRTNSWKYYVKGALVSQGDLSYTYTRAASLFFTANSGSNIHYVDFLEGDEVKLVLERTSEAGDFVGIRMRVIPLLNLTLDPPQVPGGTPCTGTLTLLQPAGTGGVTVTLSSSDPAAQVPASVRIGAGRSDATFRVTSNSVVEGTPVIIHASLGGTETSDAKLTILAPALSGFNLDPTSITGGFPVRATIRLTSNAPEGGITIPITSSDPHAIPDVAFIPAGQKSVAIAINTLPVSRTLAVTLKAAYGTKSFQRSLRIILPRVGLITCEPTEATGGETIDFAITLTGPAPAGGIRVNMTSSDPCIPVTFFRMPAGVTTMTVSIVSKPVTANVNVIVSASCGGVTRSTTLLVRK